MCENLSKDLSNWFNHLFTASPSLWVLSELVVFRPGSGPPTKTPENREKLLLHLEAVVVNKTINHPTCAGDEIIFQQPPLAVLTCQACVQLVAAAGGGGGGGAAASSESSEVV